MWQKTQSRLVTLFVVLLLACVAGAGCDDPPPPWVETAKGFVQVADGRFVYKAVSPEGDVIGVRLRPNTERGDLDYWSEVFRLEMVEGKGYRLTNTQDVQSKDGVAGRRFTFEVASGKTPFTYDLALFVTDKSLVTLESGVESSRLERHRPALDQALQTLQMKAREQ